MKRITKGGLIVTTAAIIVIATGMLVSGASIDVSDIPINETAKSDAAEPEGDADPPIEIVEPPTLIDNVADIIFDNMIPQPSWHDRITEEEAYAAANQILYCMDIHGMRTEEDLAYVLSLFYLESKFDPLAENPYSSASGFGQVLAYTHRARLTECGGWESIECNIYVAFDIMAYQEFAHNTPERRWRNIYRYNYNTGIGTGGYVIRHYPRFSPLVEGILNEDKQ